MPQFRPPPRQADRDAAAAVLAQLTAGQRVPTNTRDLIADAGGTSREVVVRVLRDLRVAGLVETGRDGVVLLAPERLHEESWPTTP